MPDLSLLIQQHVQTAIATVLRRAGISGSTIDAANVNGVLPDGKISMSHADLTGVTSDQHHARSHDHATAADGTALLPESLEITGGPFAVRGDISPAQITADQNDYTPTGLADAVVLRLTSDASRTITGLGGGADGRVLMLANVGAQTITLADESASSLAANRFALAANLTLGADTAVTLLYDSTSSRWRLVSGGAPISAPYVTTASDSALSAEVVIPGLAASADISGAGGGGISEEYDSTTTGLTWSPSAPTTVDSDTTVQSHLYISTDSTERFGTRAWAPAGAFDARCKLSVTTETINGLVAADFGLHIADSTNANRLLANLVADPGNQRWSAAMYTFAASAFTQRGATWLLDQSTIYARISRDGSNNVSFWLSDNGIVWQLVATVAFTLTVASIGYRVSASGALTFTGVSDWLRTDV